VIDRRRFFCTIIGGLLAVSRIALAQQAGKLPVVGVLVTDTRGSYFLPALDQGLREIGYVDGQNIVIRIGSAGGKPEAIPGIVAELVQLKVDVLIAVGPALARAAKEASSTIPIVAVDFESDPVQAGWASSLARPSGNLTGLFLNLPDLAGKWLELLKEVAPGPRRVGVLWDVATGSAQLDAVKAAAQRFAIDLYVMEFHSVDDVDAALTRGLKAGMRSLVALSSPNVSRSSKPMADFARKNQLPAISPFRGFAEGGGLMSYGPNVAHFYRRTALYVDKIVKGAKPGDLPIEQPTKFELVLNLGTAKALGLAIPQSLWLLKDEVIQ
jgi:putative ABC transport system substrate-binding protein